jgi:hypothetical protein
MKQKDNEIEKLVDHVYGLHLQNNTEHKNTDGAFKAGIECAIIELEEKYQKGLTPEMLNEMYKDRLNNKSDILFPEMGGRHPKVQDISVSDILDEVSVKISIFLAKHKAGMVFKHVDFEIYQEVVYNKGIVLTFVPKNFFTALLYEEIFFIDALFGATEYVFDKGKFVWKDDSLWFASVKEQPTEKYVDKNGVVLKNGDIIDLHQTVNGQNIFLVLSVSPLDIRYGNDYERRYEYDKEEMLEVSRFCGTTGWEIVDHVSKHHKTNS